MGDTVGMAVKGLLAAGALLGVGAFCVPEAPIASAPPTYAEQIAPLLNKHCVDCHRPGEVGPFTLLS